MSPSRVIAVQTNPDYLWILPPPPPPTPAPNAFYLYCSCLILIFITFHPLSNQRHDSTRCTTSRPSPFVLLGMFPEPDSSFFVLFLPVLEWVARPLTLMPNQRPACFFSAPIFFPLSPTASSERPSTSLECTVHYSANFCECSVILTLWPLRLFFCSVLFIFRGGDEKAHCRKKKNVFLYMVVE